MTFVTPSPHLRRLWRLPALAIAANVVLLLMLVSSPTLGAQTMRLYEVMFYATPAIGIVVLCSAAWLRLSGPPQQRSGRAVWWWSALAVTEPVWLFVLQVVLTGFAR